MAALARESTFTCCLANFYTKVCVRRKSVVTISMTLTFGKSGLGYKIRSSILYNLAHKYHELYPGDFFPVPNIIFKIPTLPLFTSSSFLGCLFSSYTIHFHFLLAKLLLLCLVGLVEVHCSWWFVCGLWLSSWWVLQCNSGGG